MKRTFFSLLLLFFVFVSGVVLGSEILNFKDLWGSPVAELRFFRMLGVACPGLGDHLLAGIRPEIAVVHPSKRMGN